MDVSNPKQFCRVHIVFRTKISGKNILDYFKSLDSNYTMKISL